MGESGLKISWKGLHMSGSGWELIEYEREWIKNKWKWVRTDGSV